VSTEPAAPTAGRLRFVLVMAGRYPERHALAAEVSDGAAPLCGVTKPGAWGLAGFTSRLDEIDCATCRRLAGAAILDLQPR
jgi:hypothetical protein